ncbi:hypothetical protein SDC9_48682 [bioreactor metagenome]|uniref:Transposase IS200-like domain-containing protein n=1 Tax=bioreactor metagenome TaxID=1076179 RepID=A0A644WIU5_9ZZZZ
MPQSYNRIWIHAIWSTKDRRKIILNSFEYELHSFMYQQFRECGCPVRIINGVDNHIHCLFLLNPQKSISDVIKQVKGSTSHFINSKNLSPVKFSWQNGFASFSVSDSVVDNIARYIENQKRHHNKKSFNTELTDFLAENRVDPFPE